MNLPRKSATRSLRATQKPPHELMDPLGKAHLQVCKGLMFWQNTAD